jgi:alkylated DNA repair dioxygenase AlkB
LAAARESRRRTRAFESMSRGCIRTSHSNDHAREFAAFYVELVGRGRPPLHPASPFRRAEPFRAAGRNRWRAVLPSDTCSGVSEARQLDLFGGGEPSFDASLAKLERVTLSADAWLDYAPGWLSGHEALFSVLSESVRWRKEKRTMYERIVEVPRLVATLPADGPLPSVIVAVNRALSKHYDETFERIGLAFYRDGAESVAWHGDYVARNLPSALVATVSLGGPRRFLFRPRGGGQSMALSLGWGDLLVMGGSTQRTFEHAIPKVRQAPPRIAVMFRPVWTEPPAQ